VGGLCLDQYSSASMIVTTRTVFAGSAESFGSPHSVVDHARSRPMKALPLIASLSKGDIAHLIGRPVVAVPKVHAQAAGRA
jgi:hypothetical protein